MQTEISWPPEYKIRRSKRARRVSLRICQYKGLEVVLPIGVSERVGHDLLETHRQWVINKLRNMAINPVERIDSGAIPTTLFLSAINENWTIETDFVDSNFIRIIPQSKRKVLTFQGPRTAVDVFRKLLIKWLCKKARKHFEPWMNKLSVESNLPFNRLSVRAQKTRWGSCSVKKNINLNYKLLFMPPEYARHIMLHELCHTVHLNHAKSFWALLQSLDENCAHNDVATRRFKTDVTTWLEL